MTITIKEVGRDLESTTPAGVFLVPPLPASKGAALHAWFMGISLKGAVAIDPATVEQESVDMFTLAMGPELYERTQEELRLPEVQPIALLCLYWQTTGIEAAQAFLDGGPAAALELILSRMGLSQQKTLPASVLENPTPPPGVIPDTFTRNGGVTK